MPVVFGRGPSARASDGLAAVAFLGMTLVLWESNVAGLLAAFPLLTGGIVAALVAQVRLHAVTTDVGAHRAIAPVVHGYVLLLAGLAVARQPMWFPALLLFYLAFVGVLSRRPMAEQV